MDAMRSAAGLVLMALLCTGMLGCSEKSEMAAPPPPEVVVNHPIEKEVTDYLEATGTTQAIESVDIRARVRGFLDKVNFQPGARVKAGDVLFVIDPREFKAREQQAAATVEQNEAQRRLAQVKADKAKNLLSSGSVAELTFLEEEAKRDVEKAQVDRAKADLDKAKLDMGFTEVRTPISGKVGVNLVDAGNLVGANENTLLTHVVNDESIYVYFNVPERDVLKYKRLYVGRNGDDGDDKEAKAYMSLADETGYPHEGVVDYVDPQVDPGTGTLRARAVFPNPKGLLSPGLFARIRIPMAKRQALLIPEIAVGIDQRGEYALVVGPQNIVEYRPVKTGQLEDRMRVIDSGLKAEDWVVVQGIQKARPGSKVIPIQEGTQTPVSKGGSSAPSPAK